MAVLTITTNAQQDARLVVAFGKKLGLPGNASAAQIKADVITYVRTVVNDQERLAVVAANPPVAFDPT